MQTVRCARTETIRMKRKNWTIEQKQILLSKLLQTNKQYCVMKCIESGIRGEQKVTWATMCSRTDTTHHEIANENHSNENAENWHTEKEREEKIESPMPNDKQLKWALNASNPIHEILK